MQIVSLGDCSHEMSNLFLREKKNKNNLVNLSCNKSAHSVVSNNSQMSVRKKKCYKMMLFLKNDLFIYFTLYSDYLLMKLLK